MSGETTDRQTIINITIEGEPQKQRSFSLKEACEICRISPTVYKDKARGASADFWKADNHKESTFEPGKKGRKRRPCPRFHHEHVEYMAAVVNGLLTEKEAADLWNTRRNNIRNELNARALAPSITPRRERRTKR